jgi:NADPH2:quinone reductase
MRAVVCKELGPPSSLVLEELDDPVAGPRQVVVDVEAAGVNFVDVLFVAGQYQIKPTLPFVPGSEIAGTVVSVGEKVSQYAVGDRVFGGIGMGGYAARAAMNVNALAPVPANLSAAQAATFTQSYCTALFALRDRARLATGDTVVVLGAGGGVGLAAIDVARALGASCIAVASSEDKRAAALAAGAAAAIDPNAESVKDRVRELTDGHGADVVVDMVGGDLAEPSLRALGYGGRYVVIGFASGTIPSLPMNQVLLRNRSIVGVDWGAWSMTHGEEQGRLLDTLLALVSSGELHPVEPTTYPLAETAKALEDLAGRRVTGKVAIVP